MRCLLRKLMFVGHVTCFRYCALKSLILQISHSGPFTFIVQFSHSFVSDSLRPHEPQHPGFPVRHQLQESTQIHGHWVSDAIQLSHPLSSPSPAPNPSQHQGLLRWVNTTWGVQSIRVSASASVLPMNTQDWSPSGWTGWISLQSRGLSRVFSNTTVQKHQFFGAQLSS